MNIFSEMIEMLKKDIRPETIQKLSKMMRTKILDTVQRTIEGKLQVEKDADKLNLLHDALALVPALRHFRTDKMFDVFGIMLALFLHDQKKFHEIGQIIYKSMLGNLKKECAVCPEKNKCDINTGECP